MSLSRANALAYVVAQLSTLLTDAGIGVTDATGALKEPIDEALLMRGVAYADLAAPSIADADVLGTFKILRYCGLKRVYDAVSNRVDIQLDGPQESKNRSQMVRQLENAVAAALKEATPFILDGATGFSTGTLTVDFVEPLPTW